MKSVILGFFLLLSWGFNSGASVELPEGYGKVPAAKEETYKKALIAALKLNPKVTSNCDIRWINDVFHSFEDIFVSKSSGQPLLIFNRPMFTGLDERIHRLLFTTTPDLKNVIQVMAEVYVKGEVNQGDLANPIIVEDYILNSQINCTPSH